MARGESTNNNILRLNIWINQKKKKKESRCCIGAVLKLCDDIKKQLELNRELLEEFRTCSQKRTKNKTSLNQTRVAQKNRWGTRQRSHLPPPPSSLAGLESLRYWLHINGGMEEEEDDQILFYIFTDDWIILSKRILVQTVLNLLGDHHSKQISITDQIADLLHPAQQTRQHCLWQDVGF